MSNQQNDEVFVIESPVDAVAFMTALERHLCVLADRYPDISNTRPGIYAGGSMAMVRHGLTHSVNDVDIAFRDRELANALRNTYGKDYFKNYKFMGVDIDFPDGAVLEGSDANSIAAASGYFYSLSELHSQYTELLRWAKEKHDKALEDKFNSRLALLRTI